MCLLSIIIPTHNRSAYAAQTIQALLNTTKDLEVVVSDTSAVDELSNLLAEHLENPRLKITRPQVPMSAVDNFNHALHFASGRYLCFIGDDDFVLPEIMDIARWAERKSIDAIKLTFPALYYWSDFKHKSRGDYYSATLHVSEFTGKVTSYGAKQSLQEALNHLGMGVMEMPRAYSGIISKDLADRICQKYGKLFGGVSADIYSAALIALESQSCIRIDYPAIVPGASGLSGSGQSASGAHLGGLRDNAYMRAFKDLTWDSLIPEFYSVPTVWSYSFLKAIEKAGLPLNQVHFGRLYAKCLIFHRGYWRHTVTSIRYFKKSCSTWFFWSRMFSGLSAELVWIGYKIKQRLFDRMGQSSTEIIRNASDIQASVIKLSTQLQEKGLRKRLLDHLEAY
jgi:glycosyltransferase involved in cell wall biosynthesis